ncbi:MAG: nitrate reductase molybdenum cofactor assembly chaperone [Bacteroidales bacterium]|nr:nitrate reductase molybdenum cofactor assembly chaperone [Bacteroidales bacterium]
MDLDLKNHRKEDCNMIDQINKLDHYKILAEIFRYPDENSGMKMKDFQSLVLEQIPEQAKKVKHLLETFKAMNLLKQQEYYLKTFDVQAVCYLDLGYVLFGEDYKRAQLLVNLQNEHKVAGVDCGSELGDHLPNVLMLLSKTTDPDFAEELGFIITTPAVRFMLTKFKDVNNTYKDMLEILLNFLQRDFKGEQLEEYALPEQTFEGAGDFAIPSAKSVICNTHCKKHKSF